MSIRWWIRPLVLSKLPGQRWFNLKGILLWTISDFLGYGLISRLCTHGYKVCTVCGPTTDTRIASSGNKLDGQLRARGQKLVYKGGTRRDHPYHRDLSFNGKIEYGNLPVQLNPEKILHFIQERENYLRSGERKNYKDDLVHKHGIKHRSILWTLPYWLVSVSTWTGT
jgi:hypothetical protein